MLTNGDELTNILEVEKNLEISNQETSAETEISEMIPTYSEGVKKLIIENPHLKEIGENLLQREYKKFFNQILNIYIENTNEELSSQERLSKEPQLTPGALDFLLCGYALYQSYKTGVDLYHNSKIVQEAKESIQNLVNHIKVEVQKAKQRTFNISTPEYIEESAKVLSSEPRKNWDIKDATFTAYSLTLVKDLAENLWNARKPQAVVLPTNVNILKAEGSVNKEISRNTL